MTGADVVQWIRGHRWLVALVAVVIAGYSLGKDAALRDNARDALQLSQTRGQLGDLCSRLLTALRQLFQTIQYAPLHLQLLPTLAQSGLDALAQQGLQLALLPGLAGARILQPLQRVGLLHTELITLLLQGGELLTLLRHACVQCLLLLEQLPALIELHTPTTQKLAQAFPLRRSAHACV